MQYVLLLRSTEVDLLTTVSIPIHTKLLLIVLVHVKVLEPILPTSNHVANLDTSVFGARLDGPCEGDACIERRTCTGSVSIESTYVFGAACLTFGFGMGKGIAYCVDCPGLPK